MLRKIKFVAAIVALMVLIVLCQAGGGLLKKGFMKGRESSETATSAGRGRLIVLDPGHGGIAGGKKGINGAEEKEINLQISLIIKELLEKENVEVVMTRSDENRIGEDRVSDLKARVDIMNRENPVLAVSIHQNSYHEESVHGAQVFYYSESKEGARAASMLQEALREADPENTKEAKANDTYYILKKTEVPTVIAECGFLSNYEEAEKLITEDYQRKMAEAIVKGILQYIEE